MENLKLSSQAWYLWDRSTGREVLDGEGASVGHAADTPVPIASLTKIMTAMVVLERRDLDEEVTITPEMLAGLEEFSTIGLREGQVATVEDLLYATLLPSAGDAAQALAISTAGSIEKFAEWMNSAAKTLGMTNTHFTNPVGFNTGTWSGEISFEEAFGAVEFTGPSNDTGLANYSTPRDIAAMLNWALKNEQFREIFETYEKELPSLGMTVRKTFVRGEYIKGGKTGFTNAAGRCLASTAEIEGQEYILVTVGAGDGGHVADAEKIYQMIEEEYEPVQLVRAGDVLARIPVRGSATKVLEFRAIADQTIALPNGVQAGDLTYSVRSWRGQELTEIGRDVDTGEPFGSWVISYKGEEIYSQGLVVYESCSDGSQGQYCVEKPGFYSYGWMLVGVIMTVLLAGVTLKGFLKGRDKGASSSGPSGSKARIEESSEVRAMKWISPWAGLAMTLVSLTVTGLAVWDCFRPTPGIEVVAPEIGSVVTTSGVTPEETSEEAENDESEEIETAEASLASGNCTEGFGNLMLINPNFAVGTEFIARRRAQLISVSQIYGISEYHEAGNGDNLMMPEAAEHLNEMLAAYRAENPGHEMGTYSCFRARGTTCGRLCAATGESDHHTGLTCDLIDLAYGSVLNTDDYPSHLEWQWLRENSYRYGFIDRFPEAWAGGSMTEPANVNAEGSTGLFETWHYRYVGVTAATEIATGKYNGGAYDSLEHYLKATGRVRDLESGRCQ